MAHLVCISASLAPRHSGRALGVFTFMKPFRFLFYCLSSVAGIVGLVTGGVPVLAHVADRLLGRSYSVVHDEFFRYTVIFFLSLILLILVHLAHRLAGAFDLSLPKKPEASESAKDPGT